MADETVGAADAAERFARPADLAQHLESVDYLAEQSLATVAWLAMRLQRPLLLEGEPGTGKTALAEALARASGVPLIRLQCYEGIDASQALYDWDFPRQILHLRAIEAVATGSGPGDLAAVEDELFTERFLLARPVLAALRAAPAVLLIDEIDRADDEFEAFLLEVLSTWQVTIPELGTISAPTPPVVVLTSNRTRDLHDALKRRCLYHWIDHPSLERELTIVRRHVPGLPDRLRHQVVTACQRLRDAPLRAEAAAGRPARRPGSTPSGSAVDPLDLIKPPGVAETIDWARALCELGVDALDTQTAAATLGAAVKHREDADRVRAALDRVLAP